MNLFFRFFLSLCFLLLNGHDYAFSFRSISHANNIPCKQENVRLITLQNNQYHVKALPPDQEKEKDKIEVNDYEDEDEELTTIRKYSAVSNYFTSFFFAQASANSCHNIKQHLRFSKHFSYFSSDKYIVFCEIRI